MLLYLKLKIVLLKRCSLLAMPFFLCCVPALLNALGLVRFGFKITIHPVERFDRYLETVKE